jgi:hypothetical protein
MSQLGNIPFEAYFTDLTEEVVVEYYITATDAFGKTTDAMNGTDYFSFTVVAPSQGFPLLPVVAVVVIAVIGVVILFYMFVYKKKD